ncbi:hypothetical protein KC669_01185 [Candidatus Dojkabacteria bacterium]|uniref:Uncharacterized protein n=1 Tax=Candidatus Dojkabacteria bacterium TaxID=2099670 RepID=A0A955LA43_9BACT|nr:hypothetical protein [Candidatus Dojkabacteria bacterium]
MQIVTESKVESSNEITLNKYEQLQDEIFTLPNSVAEIKVLISQIPFSEIIEDELVISCSDDLIHVLALMCRENTSIGELFKDDNLNLFIDALGKLSTEDKFYEDVFILESLKDYYNDNPFNVLLHIYMPKIFSTSGKLAKGHNRLLVELFYESNSILAECLKAYDFRRIPVEKQEFVDSQENLFFVEFTTYFFSSLKTLYVNRFNILNESSFSLRDIKRFNVYWEHINTVIGFEENAIESQVQFMQQAFPNYRWTSAIIYKFLNIIDSYQIVLPDPNKLNTKMIDREKDDQELIHSITLSSDFDEFLQSLNRQEQRFFNFFYRQNLTIVQMAREGVVPGKRSDGITSRDYYYKIKEKVENKLRKFLSGIEL